MSDYMKDNVYSVEEENDGYVYNIEEEDISANTEEYVLEEEPDRKDSSAEEYVIDDEVRKSRYPYRRSHLHEDTQDHLQEYMPAQYLL